MGIMEKTKIKCFFLEPTEYMQVSLRRYKGAQDGQPLCNHTNSYHDANVIVVPMIERPKDQNTGRGLLEHPDYPHDDPRWPRECPCGFKFKDDAHWQVNERILYTTPEMNGLTTIDDAPVGAMWDAWWYDHKGPDGMCLVVRTPGGDWIIEGPEVEVPRLAEERRVGGVLRWLSSSCQVVTGRGGPATLYLRRSSSRSWWTPSCGPRR
jgi:hypothetical protein